MINMKLQNMKQAAYFDYFKSFSLNAFDTIKKLQTQFKQQIEESFFFDPNLMFKRVKTLLSSYQILIYQINDSCQFVQIPEFGNCIMKIFLQIMSIIRFLLHKIVQKSNKKQSEYIDRNHSINNSNNHNIGIQVIIDVGILVFIYSEQQVNIEHEPNQFIPYKYFIEQPETNIQKEVTVQIYDKQSQTVVIITIAITNLNHLKFQKAIQKYHLRYLFLLFQVSLSQTSGKQKLQSIQISQNQNILSQALNSFCKKGQHLKNFVNVRQAAMISNMKQGVGQYIKLKDILDQDSNVKLTNATTKLQQLFKVHTVNYIKQKQSEMIHQQLQVSLQQPLQSRLLEQNKHIKKLNEKIKKLIDEIEFEKQKNKSLQNLLKSKTEQFQIKTMEYRVAKIQMENLKNKNKQLTQSQINHNSSNYPTNNYNASTLNNLSNGSKHQICSHCHSKITSSPQYKKTQLDCVSKSIIQGSQQNQVANSQSTDRKTDQVIPNTSKLMEKMTRKVHYQNISSLTKKQLAFKPIDSKSDQFQIISLVWQLKIQPTFQVLSNQYKKQPSKKRTIVGRVTSTNMNNYNMNMNNTFSYRDHRRIKTKMLTTQSKNSMDIEKVLSFTYNGSKTNVNDNTKLLGIKKYSKKISDSAISNIQTEVIRQVTQKWLDNDRLNFNDKVNQNQYDNQGDYNQCPVFERNKFSSFQSQNSNSKQNINDLIYQDKSLQRKTSKLFQTFAQKSNHNTIKNKDQNMKMINNNLLIKKQLSKSQSNIFSNAQVLSTQNNHINQQSQHYQSFQLNSGSRMIMSPNNINNMINNMNESNIKIIKQQIKYPKFIKNSVQYKIQISLKDLNNLYFDVNTAKNIQYINLFHNDDLRVNTAVKAKRKTNQALNVNIQQMQKKNYINTLISKVKGQVNHKNTIHNSNNIMCNTQSIESLNSTKLSKNYLINQSKQTNQSKSLTNTFSGTLMKTQFWNQFINLQTQNNSHKDQQEINNLLKCYDFQSLIAMLFKQLKDLKRISTLTAHNSLTNQTLQMNNYEIIRNFIRYPFSAITLQNDKTFLQKQRQENGIQYLELRKIMQRVFKLHKNCQPYQVKNTFEKLTINQFNKQNHNHSSHQKDQVVLCSHLIEFFETVGILLIPKPNRVITQPIQDPDNQLNLIVS